MQNISLCITTHNRLSLTLDSFDKVYSDPRIDEVVIVDDCSDPDILARLEDILSYYLKVKFFKNQVNLGCYHNKARAVTLAKNDYVIILDSDNCIDTHFIDRIYQNDWDEKTILAPTFAKPTFDYREFAGQFIDRKNVHEFLNRPLFDTALNTFNFFINRREYIKTFDRYSEPVTADSIYFNYCWLDRGNKIKFVKGLEYDHLVHEASHYKLNNHLTNGFYEKVIKNLADMR